MLVVVKESYEPVMAGLRGLTGHHWISQGVFNVVLFVVLGVVLTSIRDWRLGGRSMAWLIFGAAAISGAIIGEFFLFK